jgi:ABC-type lipoprotein export system ATPase subunit
MIEVEGLSQGYDGRTVLSLPSFIASQGQHWLILGRSGSGKSTLLHILAGLLTPDRGRVVVAGKDFAVLNGAVRDRFRGTHIGVVFQRMHLIDALTVEQNLALAPWLAGVSGSSRHAARIDELLDSLGLSTRRSAYPHELSVGEAQRVALARAVVNRPRVLLADEPTSSLDDENCDAVLSLLIQQAEDSGATLLIVTHDQRVKARVANRLELASHDAA